MLACSCLNRVEYHQFERVKYEIESGKTEFFLRSIDFNNFFYFAGVFLGVPDFFVILKAGLHVRRKHKGKYKSKERGPFSCACV